MGDLKENNQTLEQTLERKTQINIIRTGEKDEILAFAITDASYQAGEKAIGGQITLNGNRKTPKISPL